MNRQHLEVYAGDYRSVILYARDYANEPMDITGATVSWRVGSIPLVNASPIFAKSGTIINGPGGVFSVVVDPADTAYLSGDYAHFASVARADSSFNFINNAGGALIFTNATGGILVFIGNSANIEPFAVTSGRFKVRPIVSA